jgi:hypothetical protein
LRTDAELFSTDERRMPVHDRNERWFDARDPGWWSQTGSNRRPPACKAGALPTELWPPQSQPAFAKAEQPSLVSGLPTEAASQRRLVGLGRFELPTSRLSSARSNQLSYKPEIFRSATTDHDDIQTLTTAQTPTDDNVSDDARVNRDASFGTGLVREEREMKTAVSRLWTKPILKPVGPDVSKRSDRERVRRL